MIKKIVISILALLIVIVGIGFFYFDSILKSGIELVGSQTLGTEVTVASVSVSPLNGSGSISGLKIANPEGFNSDYAIELDSVSVNVNVSSIFSDVIEIESVTIVQPNITYETRITNDNIRTLLNNLSGDAEAAVEEDSVEGGGKKVIIRELRILDPQLNLVTAIVSAPIPLPDIELSDIGDDGESVSMAEAMRVTLSALSRSILSANLPDLSELTESVQGQLQEGVDAVGDAVESTVEELGNRLRGILN